MMDERLDDRIGELARGYNEPPATPKDEMWARIEASRRFRRPRGADWRRWAGWGVGLAAMLAVGFGVGRLSVRPEAPAVATAEPQGAAASMPLQMAAVQHLSRVEVLLTAFRSEQGAGGAEDVDAWARDLLSTTRLLLDSSAAQDPELARMLGDLELVLVQITQLRPTAPAGEKELITEAIEQGNVIPRLRALVPAGAPRVSL